LEKKVAEAEAPACAAPEEVPKGPAYAALEKKVAEAEAPACAAPEDQDATDGALPQMPQMSTFQMTSPGSSSRHSQRKKVAKIEEEEEEEEEEGEKEAPLNKAPETTDAASFNPNISTDDDPYADDDFDVDVFEEDSDPEVSHQFETSTETGVSHMNLVTISTVDATQSPEEDEQADEVTSEVFLPGEERVSPGARLSLPNPEENSPEGDDLADLLKELGEDAEE